MRSKTPENETPQKVLSVAYGFLARRSHGRVELKRKLERKGYAPELIDEALACLVHKGYLNDEDVALRWAQSFVRNRLWGRAKIGAYLTERGIACDIIDRVQGRIWEEFQEDDIARRALAKRFSHGPPPTRQKISMFLNSRGFSADVIYRAVSESTPAS